MRSALEAEGVAAIVAGEHLTSLQGETPAGSAAQYQVCIVDTEQLPRASHLVEQWLQEGVPGRSGSWTCQACGERHEPHFESCWKCGGDAEPA